MSPSLRFAPLIPLCSTSVELRQEIGYSEILKEELSREYFAGTRGLRTVPTDTHNRTIALSICAAFMMFHFRPAPFSDYAMPRT